MKTETDQQAGQTDQLGGQTDQQGGQTDQQACQTDQPGGQTDQPADQIGRDRLVSQTRKSQLGYLKERDQQESLKIERVLLTWTRRSQLTHQWKETTTSVEIRRRDQQNPFQGIVMVRGTAKVTKA